MSGGKEMTVGKDPEGVNGEVTLVVPWLVDRVKGKCCTVAMCLRTWTSRKYSFESGCLLMLV